MIKEKIIDLLFEIIQVIVIIITWEIGKILF